MVSKRKTGFQVPIEPKQPCFAFARLGGKKFVGDLFFAPAGSGWIIVAAALMPYHAIKEFWQEFGFFFYSEFFRQNSSRGFPVCLIIYLMTNKVTVLWCGTQVVNTLPLESVFLNVMCLLERAC